MLRLSTIVNHEEGLQRTDTTYFSFGETVECACSRQARSQDFTLGWCTEGALFYSKKLTTFF